MVIYLQMRPVDMMVSVAFFHVSFMWYVSDRLLSKLTPRSQTLSVSSMTVLAKESFSMLGILVNRDVNSIPSVFSVLLLSMFCVFHRITSSIQFQLFVCFTNSTFVTSSLSEEFGSANNHLWEYFIPKSKPRSCSFHDHSKENLNTFQPFRAEKYTSLQHLINRNKKIWEISFSFCLKTKEATLTFLPINLTTNPLYVLFRSFLFPPTPCKITLA